MHGDGEGMVRMAMKLDVVVVELELGLEVSVRMAGVVMDQYSYHTSMGGASVGNGMVSLPILIHCLVSARLIGRRHRTRTMCPNE